MKAVILAAGIGSRLGQSCPKPLTPLKNGQSILHNQIINLTKYLNINEIYIVVGFKKDLIMEVFPDLTFVYNDQFDTSNTAFSLIRGLNKIEGEDVIFLNGDVVFDHRIIGLLMDNGNSCVAVNTEKVGDEEVKYTKNSDGTIKEISKEVKDGLGEAVGINLLKSNDLDIVRSCLNRCSNTDYFEKGLEYAIEGGMKLYPVCVNGFECIEVDFVEDLEKAVSLKINMTR
jgi:choline kinase